MNKLKRNLPLFTSLILFIGVLSFIPSNVFGFSSLPIDEGLKGGDDNGGDNHHCENEKYERECGDKQTFINPISELISFLTSTF